MPQTARTFVTHSLQTSAHFAQAQSIKANQCSAELPSTTQNWQHCTDGHSRLAVRRLEGWPLARSRLWPSFETRAILRGAAPSGARAPQDDVRAPQDEV